MSSIDASTPAGLDDEALDVALSQVRRAAARRPFIDLRDLLVALRRWRQYWIALAAVGMVIGIGLSLVQSRQYSATTTILLGHPSGIDPSHSIQTDADLLHAKQVARATIKSLGIHESPDSLISQYGGTILSDDLLQVEVSAASSADAVRRADVIAHEYLAFRKRVYQKQLDVMVAGLQRRKSALEAEQASLTTSIGAAQVAGGAGSGASGSDPELDQLVTKSADVTAELAFVRGTILNETNATTQRIEGSAIVDPASSVNSSMLGIVAMNAATGLAAGLVLGIGLIVLFAAVSDRAWRREDVATALQAPVALSVRSLKLRRSTPPTELRAELELSSSDLEQVVAYLRGSIELESSLDRSLAVVSVASLPVSALIVASLALELAREGARVVLVDFTARARLATLLGLDSGIPLLAGSVPGAIRIVDPLAADPLVDADDAGRDFAAAQTEEPAIPPRDVVLVLAELDPAVGARGLRYWTSGAVAVVTAGRPTVGTLVSTNEMLRAVAIDVRSAVLVGADPRDDTLGIVVDDEGRPTRATHPVLPSLPAHLP